MADHVAEQIVQAAVAALTGLVTTGANVFDSRVYPLQHSELPALLIDQESETAGIEGKGSGGIALLRTLTLVVIAKVEQTTSYRRTVNTIRKEVEARLALDVSLAGAAKYLSPTSFELELEGGAEEPVASGTMKFEVIYYTAFPSPDVPL